MDPSKGIPDLDDFDDALDYPDLTVEQEAEIDKVLAAGDQVIDMSPDWVDNDDLMDEEELLTIRERMDVIAQLSPAYVTSKSARKSKLTSKGKYQSLAKQVKVKTNKAICTEKAIAAEKAIDAVRGKGKEVERLKKKTPNSPDLIGVLQRSSTFSAPGLPQKKSKVPQRRR